MRACIIRAYEETPTRRLSLIARSPCRSAAARATPAHEAGARLRGRGRLRRGPDRHHAGDRLHRRADSRQRRRGKRLRVHRRPGRGRRDRFRVPGLDGHAGRVRHGGAACQPSMRAATLWCSSTRRPAGEALRARPPSSRSSASSRTCRRRLTPATRSSWSAPQPGRSTTAHSLWRTRAGPTPPTGL